MYIRFSNSIPNRILFLITSPYKKESSGYEIAMCDTPYKRPIICCLSTICCPCAQWYTRRIILNYDMTQYKLWQGYYDGPQCCARSCPNAPITIKSGTYGEEKCPNLFLCLEVYVYIYLSGCGWNNHFLIFFLGLDSFYFVVLLEYRKA